MPRPTLVQLEAMNTLFRIRKRAEQHLQLGRQEITLALSQPGPPRGEQIRLTPTCGPLGRVLNATLDGGRWSVVARFGAAAVVRFCDRVLDQMEGR